MKKITNPLDLAAQAANEYRLCYGSMLLSAIVFGSAAGGDFDPERSDINLLLVLGQTSLKDLERSVEIQDRWCSRRFSRPLFLDKAYIASSLDSFPIEFLNMKKCYKVMQGEDVLASIEIRHEHLRLQIERELKGKRIHLMQEWLSVRKSPQQIKRLLGVSLADFTPIFRALLSLRKVATPADRLSVFTAIDSTFGIQQNTFKRANEAYRSGNKEQIAAVFYEYAAAVIQIISLVDQEREEKV
jgi:predicted nucleotidyltransferase